MEELSHIVTKHLRLTPYLSMKDIACMRSACKDWNYDLKGPLNDKWDRVLESMQVIVKHEMFDKLYENFDIYFTASSGSHAGNRMRLRFKTEWRVWSIELSLLHKQGYQELSASVLFRTTSREAFAGLFDSRAILDDVLSHDKGRFVGSSYWKNMSTFKHVLWSVVNGNPGCVKWGSRLLPKELVDVVTKVAKDISGAVQCFR